MNNSDKIILDLCGGTGSWSLPYKNAGYDVRIITLPYYDVLTYQPPDKVYGILAAPPCTHFSCAGNRLWKIKDNDGRTQQALDILFACLLIIKHCNPEFWCLENPKGRLNRFIGNPVLKINMCDFGAKYKKPTYLWGNFNTMLIYGPFETNTKPFDTLRTSELYQLPDGYNLNIDHNKRAAQRSIYPPFFCESFFLANQ